MFLVHIMLRAVLGAVLFRGRSGIFNHLACLMAGKDSTRTKLIGDTEARILYAVLMVTLQFDRMPLSELAMVAAALFIGTLPAWPDVPNLRDGNGRRWRNFALLALRGLCFTAPAGAVLLFTGHQWWFGLVGLLWAICYPVAQMIPSRVPYLRQGSELGEATFGGAQALAFALI